MAKLWGGRFKGEMHPVMKCFSYSLYKDFELLEAEIEVDIAWAKMLRRSGLVSRQESARLVRGLESIAKELIPKDPHAGVSGPWLNQYEDVHSLVQAALEKKVGAVAKKLHTGRSRNDLVATSTRIYCLKQAARIEGKMIGAQAALVFLAEKAGTVVVAGLTHTKKAQPILMAHHLMAYVEMLEGDKSRLRDFAKRLDLLPLGSAALAGSSLPIDQKFLARELGFTKIARNSLAAVSDRALVTEFLSVLSILWVHLSRLSEDFILWNSEYFGFIELGDAFATGSSLMPQKKNPDVFELIRGRSAVIFGHLQTLLTLQKGLPLSYNRDLQEDKPALFDAIHKTSLALEVLALTLSSSTWNQEALRESALDDNLYATDILEYLVKKKIPFASAHEIVGKAVRFSLERGRPLRELSLTEWKKFSPVFDQKIYDLFDAKKSVSAKQTIGSTNPVRVRKEIQRWSKYLRP